MNNNMDMNQDEILVRNHKALKYSTRVFLRQMKQKQKMDRIVCRVFGASVLFFLWVLSLALLVGAV